MRPSTIGTVIALAALLGGAAPAASQGAAGMEKQVLPMTAANWAAFRNYDGSQWIYFTHLAAFHCGLREVRYALNGDAPSEVFPLQPCDPDNPHRIDVETYPPYLRLPPATATSIAIRIVYTDGEESEVVRLAPCPGVTDDTTCAVLVE